jgi:hypothetical protein
MKKNVMMRVASALLVAVLLSTCAISGTFAKYVTTKTGTDSARVAKWGVEITANGTTFAKAYNDAADAAGTQVVSTEKVVAPGTNGSLAAMTLSGTPEVAVNVKYEATLKLEDWTIGTEEYCPIVFTVNGTTYATKAVAADKQSDDIAALITAVTDAIGAYSKDYPANQDLSVEGTVATPDVAWAWAYEGDNAKDTALGNQAADGSAPTITLTITTTVTQID